MKAGFIWNLAPHRRAEQPLLRLMQLKMDLFHRRKCMWTMGSLTVRACEGKGIKIVKTVN